MLPFASLLKIEKSNDLAVYKQIVNGVIENIQSGIIKPGYSLPSSREMATLLKLHRNTIIAAYNELAAQDWVEIVPRKGIFVKPDLLSTKPRTFTAPSQNPAYHEPGTFDFEDDVPGFPHNTAEVTLSTIIINDGFTDVRLAPMEYMMRTYRKLLNEKGLSLITRTRNFDGTPNLKESLKNFLNDTRGLNIAPENILITRGAQMAIFLSASLIIKPGDKVIVSDPNYFIANNVFTTLGATLIPVPVDAEGMVIDAVADILKTQSVKLLYITPHHHHPTTVTLSHERRLQLLQLVTGYGLPVIEDDYDYDFHYQKSPMLPLASLNHQGNVIYIGSMTKLLAPNFRVGYLVAPPEFIRQATNLKCLVDLGGDALMEEAISVLIDSGEINHHINKLNKIYSRRCDLICELINRRLQEVISFKKPPGGMALWVKFAEQFPLQQLIPQLTKNGLQITGNTYNSFDNQHCNATRLGFASLNAREMTQAVAILEKTLL